MEKQGDEDRTQRKEQPAECLGSERSRPYGRENQVDQVTAQHEKERVRRRKLRQEEE